MSPTPHPSRCPPGEPPLPTLDGSLGQPSSSVSICQFGPLVGERCGPSSAVAAQQNAAALQLIPFDPALRDGRLLCGARGSVTTRGMGTTGDIDTTGDTVITGDVVTTGGIVITCATITTRDMVTTGATIITRAHGHHHQGH